jgi:hypothetical protein
MAEQDFLKHLAKLGQHSGSGKAVGRKSMPRISITIDEEFRLPDELGGQQLEDGEDGEDDFPFPDMEQQSPFGQQKSPMWSGAKGAGTAAKRALGKSKRAQRLKDEKKKKEKD